MEEEADLRTAGAVKKDHMGQRRKYAMASAGRKPKKYVLFV